MEIDFHVESTWKVFYGTAEVLVELQLLLMQGDQLIGLVPLWRLMTSTVDPHNLPFFLLGKGQCHFY